MTRLLAWLFGWSHMYGRVGLWCLNTEQLCCRSEQEAKYPWDIWWGLEQAEHTGVYLGCCVLMGKNDRSCMIIRYNNKHLYNSCGKVASASYAKDFIEWYLKTSISANGLSVPLPVSPWLFALMCLFWLLVRHVAALIWTVTLCKLGLIRILAIIVAATVGTSPQDPFCRA